MRNSLFFIRSQMADAIHENQKQKDFKYLTQNLHHLVSTKHVRGVYNPRVQVMEVCNLIMKVSLGVNC
jgi:hypothetical protein